MPFTRGVSGNPGGRKPGQTAGAQIRKAIEKRKDEILQAVINKALEGDMTAAKMLLDRITPTLKPVAPAASLPHTKGAGLAEQGATVINAAMTGIVSPDVASMLLSAIANQSKILEIDELVRRIEKLENRNDKP